MELDQWENKTAFFAGLTALGSSKVDYSLYALWSFRDAFETPEDQRPRTAAVRAASLWFIYAADTLWSNAKNERVFEGRSGAAGDKPELHAKDWTGFNLERWALWSSGLERAEEADDGATALIKQAKNAIDRAVNG